MCKVKATKANFHTRAFGRKISNQVREWAKLFGLYENGGCFKYLKNAMS